MYRWPSRAGLGHVWDVRPNRAADFVSCKGIPDLNWDWIGFHFATHCNVDQITRNEADRCVLRAYNTAKCDSGQGSAPDSAVGAYNASPDTLSGFWGEGEGKGRKGEGMRWEGLEGWGREGEVDSDAQLEVGTGSPRAWMRKKKYRYDPFPSLPAYPSPFPHFPLPSSPFLPSLPLHVPLSLSHHASFLCLLSYLPIASSALSSP